MYPVLKLAILAQALQDVLLNTPNDEEYETAWKTLEPYPKLIDRVNRMSPRAKKAWGRELERVLKKGAR